MVSVETIPRKQYNKIVFFSVFMIEGAVFAANTWLVPKDAKKLEDPRRVRKMEKNKK